LGLKRGDAIDPDEANRGRNTATSGSTRKG
jgi:hypothetical protein